MGNAYLCHQIALALETYTAKQQEKLKELYKPSNGNNDFDDKIDIS
jgi:hypothetical protein